ncbi:Indigoidine synthase A family protein [Dimargaris cristalligena]|uniref:Indigoidine synthase A family protein n=1 Tax=Dimargaris cristalligena TaxID=215637 RepID=A0A4P9ZRA5_9FUNG|nr:Indigoidine synthase A family protein [Dimargaris cristalligena]|eukprot:RKP35973.1 Indigoidine synthase A family protein [Dimargaris cristalligena]
MLRSLRELTRPFLLPLGPVSRSSHRPLFPSHSRTYHPTRAAPSAPWLSSDFVQVTPEVREALAVGRPVVALESTIITHGMPYPANIETAQTVEAIVREQGCTPATIAVWGGRIQVGLTNDRLLALGETARLPNGNPAALQPVKTSRRDLAAVLSRRLPGATTVATTMLIAHQCGIPLFVTGGIGGVHRDGHRSLDISADLTELGRTPVAVVCAGSKSILDIPRTLEYLETQGVPVITVGPGPAFPAFFAADSGCRSPWFTSSTRECAHLVATQLGLPLQTGMVLAVPIPIEGAANGALIQQSIQQAIQEASDRGISGKDVTPFLLQRVNELTKGESLKANVTLIKNNATVGSTIARELADLRKAKVNSP